MSKPTTITIILGPAAPTEWDQADRIQGSADLPPAAGADDAARAVIESAAAPGPQLVLSAPDEASRSVARRLAKAVSAKVKTVGGLAEPGLGLWEGLARQACIERYPTAFKQWRANPAGVQPPEGEPFTGAVERIISSFARAVDKSGKSSVAVVARPAALAIIARHIKGEPILADWSSAPGPGVISVETTIRDVKATPVLRATAEAAP